MTHSEPVHGRREVEASLRLVDTALVMLTAHWDELSDERRREIVEAAGRRVRRVCDAPDGVFTDGDGEERPGPSGPEGA